jgi:hypothetical protein
MRRRWPLPLAAALLALASACSGDDDDTTAAPATTTAGIAPATGVGGSAVATPAAPTPTTTPPSLTSPATVLADTDAVGGSTLSTVDLATGRATTIGTVGEEVGVLGIATAPDGRLDAVTDAPALLVLDPAALGATGAGTPIDAGGETLVALATHPSDGTLFAVTATGTVVTVDRATGAAAPIGAVAIADPGVGLDVTADGMLEVVVATGERFAVDPDTGNAAPLPALTGDEAPPRVVAVAHDATARYGIDAAADELVTIADDGTVTTIGPLGLDVTDGASLVIEPDGRALLANPG